MHSRRKAVGTWRWSLSVLAGCLALTFALPARAAGVTDDMIMNDAKTPGDVLSYGMSPHQHRFSPLAKINAQNVKHLVPAWTFSFGGEKQRGQQAQPMVYNGKVFTTGSYSRAYAVNARTGEKLWEYDHRLP
jgi:alcohol dehydrogenase (cytochrome c)